MKIIELIMMEDEKRAGVDTISLVYDPAIEENFVALSKQQEGRVTLSSESMRMTLSDADKRIVTGAALVPNKPIYRNDGGDEYYIYFSKDTTRKASESFLKNGYQRSTNLEHEEGDRLKGVSVVESWIIEDEVNDKSRFYKMNLPVGTWMVSMKIDNDEVWKEYIKEGKVRGFSIEGWFVDKMKTKAQPKTEQARLK